MTEQQIPQLAGAFVTHQRHFNELPTADAQWVIQNTQAAIALCVEAIKNRENGTTKKLLESVATFKAQGAKEFVAKKRFVINTSENARVRISWLGGNFEANFLGKTETDIAECELKIKKLKKASLDAPIIVALGCEEKAEISLCEFRETLAHKQATRDFSWLVAYIRDVNCMLWAVSADWNGDGWCVEAYSVGSPHWWSVGYEFVSR